jgi:uncharacterized membrane protein
MIDFPGPFHPRWVHFPIAPSSAGVFFSLAGWLFAARSPVSSAGAERWQSYGRRWPYFALLALAVVLVLVESWLGSTLVYTYGVGVR